MKTQIRFSPIILFIGFSLSSSAQNKNSFHASFFYPASIGNNFLNANYRDVIGVDLGYQYSITKKISIGPDYSVSLHNEKITFTDASGNVTGNDLVTLFIQDFDAMGAFSINTNNELKISVEIAGGYTLLNTEFSNSTFGKVKTNESGYNITPAVKLTKKISDHFSIFASGGYSYKHLVRLSDQNPQVMTSYNQNLQSINAGLGSEFSF